MADYRLVRSGVLLGTLTQTASDMPWWHGELDPAPEFEAVSPLFDQERALMEADDWDSWGVAHAKLAAGLVLEPLDGREPITDFLLHIDGQRAWWRY